MNYMTVVTCEFCNREFKKKESQILLHPKNFCSSSCAHQGNKRGKIFPCFVCGKTVYKSLKEINRSKTKNYFCSIICANIWSGKQHRSSNHPNWKYGEKSYKTMMKREGLLEKCFLCKEKDTRVLAIHHIDKNRKNNNVENLVCMCHNCHFLVHHYEDVENKFHKKIGKYANS